MTELPDSPGAQPTDESQQTASGEAPTRSAAPRSMVGFVLALTWQMVRATLFVVVIVLLVVVIALVWLTQTTSGRAFVAQTLNDSLSGAVMVDQLRIGRIDGPILGSLSLHDVVIRDAQGRSAIEIDEIAVRYDLLPLIQLRVVVPELSVEGVRVAAHITPSGGFNLAALTVPSDSTEPAQGGSGVHVELQSIRIRDGSFVIRDDRSDGARLVQLVGLSVDGRFGLQQSGEMDAALTRVQMLLSPPVALDLQLPVALNELQLRLSGPQIQVQLGELTAGNTGLTGLSATVELDPQGTSMFRMLEARLPEVHLDPEEANRFVEGLNLLQPLDIRTTLSGPPQELGMRMRVQAGENEARLAFVLDITDPAVPGYSGSVEMVRFQPHEIVDLMGFKVDLSALLNVRGRGITPQDARARLMLDVGPSRLNSYGLEYAWVTAHATYGEFVLDSLELAGMGAWLRMAAEGDLDGRVSLEVDGSVEELSSLVQLVPDFPEVTGAVDMDVQIQGALPVNELTTIAELPLFELVERTLQELTINGHVGVRGLRAMEMGLDALDLEMVSPRGDRPRIDALVRASGLSAGAERLDTLSMSATVEPDRGTLRLSAAGSRTQRSLDTELSAQWSADEVVVSLTRLLASELGYDLRLLNQPTARVRLSPEMAPVEASLTSTQLSIEGANLTLSGDWGEDGRIAAQVESEPVDLAILNEVLVLPELLSGMVSGRASLQGTLARPRVEADVTASGVSFGPLLDLDASLQTQLTSQGLALSVHAAVQNRPLLAVQTGEAGVPLLVNLESGVYRLDSGRPLSIQGEVFSVDVAPFLERLEATREYAVIGNAGASFALSGTLEEPRFAVDVVLEDLGFTYGILQAAGLAASDAAPTRLSDISMVIASEYSLNPQNRDEWQEYVRGLAPDGMASRETVLSGSSVAGCAATLLQSQVEQGQQDEERARSMWRTRSTSVQSPGLRAALWMDWQGCPLVRSNLFVDADLRPVMDDPESALHWLSRTSGQTLSGPPDQAADRFQRWLDDVMLELVAHAGPLDSQALPAELVAASGLVSGVLELDLRSSAALSGGVVVGSLAVERLKLPELPAVSSITSVRLDESGLMVDAMALAGGTEGASPMMAFPTFEARDLGALRAQLPADAAAAQLSAGWNVTLNEVLRGNLNLEAPLQARAQLIRVPMAELAQELGLDLSALSLAGHDDPLWLLRDTDATGFVDVTGTVREPELFARLAMRGLRTSVDDTSDLGVELHLAQDVAGSAGVSVDMMSMTMFMQNRTRGLLDGTLALELPDEWMDLLADPGALLRQSRVEGDVTAVRTSLRELLPPVLVGAWLDEVGGMLDMNMHVEGPVLAPLVSGSMSLSNARMGVIPLGRRLNDMDMTVQLDGERIVLERFHLRDSTGTADATGAIELDGLLPRTLNLETRLDSFLMADPSGNGVFVSGDILMDGATVDDLLTLNVTLDSLVVDVPDTAGSTSYGATAPPSTILYVNEDVAADQVGQQNPQLLATDEAAAITVPLQADVNIRTRGRNEVHQSLADLIFEIDMQARIRGLSYSLRGSVRVPEGTVKVAGKQFTLERGFVTFDGTVDTVNPVVDVRAVHYLSSDVAARLEPASGGEANVSVVIDGKLEELFASDSGAIRLQSDPQMSQEDIIFVLLTGRPRDASSEVEGDQQALATASSLAAGLLADRLLSETGIPIDTIRIDGDAQSGQAFARVEGGKYITEDVYVSGTYINSQDPRENDFEFALEWIILRLGSASMRTEIRAGNKGNGGLELLWNLTRPGRSRVARQPEP